MKFKIKSIALIIIAVIFIAVAQTTYTAASTKKKVKNEVKVTHTKCGGGEIDPKDSHDGEGGKYCGVVTYGDYTIQVDGSADGSWIARHVQAALDNGGTYTCSNGSSALKILDAKKTAPPPVQTCTPSYSCSGDNIINNCSGGSTNCPYGCLNGSCNSCPGGICPVCGNVSGITDTIPTSNFCSPGSASPVSVQLGDRAWEWQCSNSYNNNVKSIGCSTTCSAGKWICNGKCVSFDTPCNSKCVGSRKLIGKVCAGNNNNSTPTTPTTVDTFGGFGILDNSSIPQITLAARVPNGEWKQATPLTSFILASGKDVELAWGVMNASMSTNCSGSSKFFSNIPVSTGSSTGPLTQSQTFTLTCKNDVDSDTKTVKVIIPAVSEF